MSLELLVHFKKKYTHIQKKTQQKEKKKKERMNEWNKLNTELGLQAVELQRRWWFAWSVGMRTDTFVGEIVRWKQRAPPAVPSNSFLILGVQSKKVSHCFHNVWKLIVRWVWLICLFFLCCACMYVCVCVCSVYTPTHPFTHTHIYETQNIFFVSILAHFLSWVLLTHITACCKWS